jgi:hypothetical protein
LFVTPTRTSDFVCARVRGSVATAAEKQKRINYVNRGEKKKNPFSRARGVFAFDVNAAVIGASVA